MASSVCISHADYAPKQRGPTLGERLLPARPQRLPDGEMVCSPPALARLLESVCVRSVSVIGRFLGLAVVRLHLYSSAGSWGHRFLGASSSFICI